MRMVRIPIGSAKGAFWDTRRGIFDRVEGPTGLDTLGHGGVLSRQVFGTGMTSRESRSSSPDGHARPVKVECAMGREVGGVDGRFHRSEK
jgi:hypothetical protein